MGQAKNRQAEIAALKAAGPKVKSLIKGFLPDAGMNSDEGLNHYWFQMAEMIGDLHTGPGMRSYTMPQRGGERHVEINSHCDIMDQEGEHHLAPQTQKGYFATMRFTKHTLLQLADEIDKGAMCVRITGTPSEVETSISGEKFRIIDVAESWSSGNHSGLMTFHVNVSGKFITTTSREFAAWLRKTALTLAQAA